MRARTALISLACAAALLVTGCSSTISGTARLAGATGGAGTTSGDGAGQAPGGLPSTPAGSPGSDGATPGSPGSDDATPGSPGSDDATPGQGNGGASGLPGATDEPPVPGVPTDLSGMPTDLGGLIGGECGIVLNVSLALATLFITPAMGGQSLTQEQVDEAFAGLSNPPPEIAGAIATLREAANASVGKPAAEALQILGSDKVSNAMDQLSDYMDSKCGGS